MSQRIIIRSAEWTPIASSSVDAVDNETRNVIGHAVTDVNGVAVFALDNDPLTYYFRPKLSGSRDVHMHPVVESTTGSRTVLAQNEKWEPLADVTVLMYAVDQPSVILARQKTDTAGRATFTQPDTAVAFKPEAQRSTTADEEGKAGALHLTILNREGTANTPILQNEQWEPLVSATITAFDPTNDAVVERQTTARSGRATFASSDASAAFRPEIERSTGKMDKLKTTGRQRLFVPLVEPEAAELCAVILGSGITQHDNSGGDNLAHLEFVMNCEGELLNPQDPNFTAGEEFVPDRFLLFLSIGNSDNLSSTADDITVTVAAPAIALEINRLYTVCNEVNFTRSVTFAYEIIMDTCDVGLVTIIAEIGGPSAAPALTLVGACYGIKGQILQMRTSTGLEPFAASDSVGIAYAGSDVTLPALEGGAAPWVVSDLVTESDGVNNHYGISAGLFPPSDFDAQIYTPVFTGNLTTGIVYVEIGCTGVLNSDASAPCGNIE